jgi:hypothetical protein
MYPNPPPPAPPRLTQLPAPPAPIATSEAVDTPDGFINVYDPPDVYACEPVTAFVVAVPVDEL